MIVYGCFSRIKNCLGRTETQTRDRMYCKTIRTVIDISRDDRARIATCSLRTPTENYSIDEGIIVTRPLLYQGGGRQATGQGSTEATCGRTEREGGGTATS